MSYPLEVMRRISALALLLLTSCQQASDVAGRNRVTVLESRIDRLERRVNDLERKIEEETPKAEPPKPTGYRLQGPSGEPMFFPTMEACMEAKGRLDEQAPVPEGSEPVSSAYGCAPVSE